jgi:1-phosphofructokinase family hexose kinase
VILSAGLTPAWQQILVFDTFRYGEVNRAREAHWCASGKVFNAGIAVHRLGGPSLTLATVGGPPWELIEREFDAMGVPHRFVVTQAATRVCTTIIDRAGGKITELVENGRPLGAEELDAFHRAYAEEVARADAVVLIGSLPAGTPTTYYRDLVAVTPCPAVLDFRGEGLLSVLDREPLVVKPNREELAQTLGRPLPTDRDLCEAMHWLNERGARWVVVTQGAGPVFVTSHRGTWRLWPPTVEHVVNPIGCGDVLAASIAWAMCHGSDVLGAVRLGMAASASNLRQLFPGRIDPTEVHEQAEGIQVEAVA